MIVRFVCRSYCWCHCCCFCCCCNSFNKIVMQSQCGWCVHNGPCTNMHITFYYCDHRMHNAFNQGKPRMFLPSLFLIIVLDSSIISYILRLYICRFWFPRTRFLSIDVAVFTEQCTLYALCSKRASFVYACASNDWLLFNPVKYLQFNGMFKMFPQNV